MKRKSCILLLLFALSAALMGCAQKKKDTAVEAESEADKEVSAAEDGPEEEVTQEFEFYLDDLSAVYYNFPLTVEVDGHTYELTEDIAYEEIGTRDVVEQVLDLEVTELAGIEEEIEYEAESGMVYTLKQEQVYVAEEGIISIPVTDTVVYENQYGKPSISTTKTITYYDEVLSSDTEIEGTLTDFYESEPGHWEDILEVEGVFCAPSYQVDTYTLSGTDNIVVSQQAESPVWDGYESMILTSLGLTSDYARITSAAWDGDQYTQDGYVMRDAIYRGDVVVTDYTAVYEGTGEAYGYSTKVFYRADAEELGADAADTTTVLQVKAIVRYLLVEE